MFYMLYLAIYYRRTPHNNTYFYLLDIYSIFGTIKVYHSWYIQTILSYAFKTKKQSSMSTKSIKCSVDISKSGSPSHNDRTSTYNARNIDKSRSHLNEYWNCYHDSSLTFEQAERLFYEERYSQTIEHQNERNKKSGHLDRNKTIDDYLNDERTKPYSIILQIGNMENQIDSELAKEIMLEQIKIYQDKYPNMHILDYSYHADEKTPHTHIRVVFDIAKNGDYIINQTKALEVMGIQLPDTTAPISRFNNVMMSWTKEIRDDFETLVQQHLPIQVDTERVPSKYNVTQEEFIRNKNRELIRENVILEDTNTSFNEKLAAIRNFIIELLQTLGVIQKDLEQRYPDIINEHILGFPPCQQYDALMKDKERLEELNEKIETSEFYVEEDEWEMEL